LSVGDGPVLPLIDRRQRDAWFGLRLRLRTHTSIIASGDANGLDAARAGVKSCRLVSRPGCS
jgi:hypothetical protein